MFRGVMRPLKLGITKGLNDAEEEEESLMLTTKREKRKKVRDVRGHGGVGCGIGNESEKGVVRGERKVVEEGVERKGKIGGLTKGGRKSR